MLLCSLFARRRFAKSLIILCTWLVALAFRLPTVYAVILVNEERKVYCNLLLDVTFTQGTAKPYYYINMFVIFSIPLLLIVIWYSAITDTLNRRKTPGLTPENSSNNSEGFRRREVVKQKVRLVSIVVAAFVLCCSFYYTHAYHVCLWLQTGP